MNELAKLFPRRPLVLSVAAWTFFFALQIVFLTIVAYERYDPPAESRLLLDRVWFVYTELPRALPMAAVYAVCAVFAVQVIGRFIAHDNPDNPTIGQLCQSLKERPVKAITWMGIRLVFLLALAGLFFGRWVPLPPWVGFVSACLAGILLVPLFISSWFDWVVKAATTEEGKETG